MPNVRIATINVGEERVRLIFETSMRVLARGSTAGNEMNDTPEQK